MSRFIDNYWDSRLLAGCLLRNNLRNPPMVFVDWDDKGRATIDLSRALETRALEMDSEDSDDEHMSDDSDDSYPGDEF